MHRESRLWWISSVFLAGSLAAAPLEKLSVLPQNPLLFGQGSRQRLIALAHYADGTVRDVTEKARFSSLKPATAEIVDGNVVRAGAFGGATIQASFEGVTAGTTALVQQADAPQASGFDADLLPVLTKLGCNGGSCHGALNGQNGFKLSLFGYEPDEDYEMIVRKHDGRRVNLAEPVKSLLLQKPTFQVQHGGGKLIKEGSNDYNALLDWLRAGAKRATIERRMVSLRLVPGNTVLHGKQATGRMLVTARYSDGSEGDVTHLVKFSSNDDSIAAVSQAGVVTALRGGETAIVVRAPGLTAAAKVGVVLEARAMPEFAAANFIDNLVFEKLKALRVPPSPLADDATFLRRASVDITGLIPTSEEARNFLADRDPNKRAKLVDDLLQRPEYADYWATYWGDHLSNTRQLLYNKGPFTFTRWLYETFRKNTPYDQFARHLLVSSGGMYDAPATSYYPLMRKELDLAAMTSQLFLGVSIDCARCHNHPLEKWTRDDFNGMAAFFSQVRYKSGTGPRNNERVLYVDFPRQFLHPDTKKSYLPKPLDGAMLESGEWTDRRELLADWLTSPKNPWFAKAIVNRMWRNFLGRGFVEPVDDFRATNPATNEPLLEALAKDFVEHGYDLHHLIRRITSSRVYQLSSAPVEGNRDDTMAYSRYYPRRLHSEQLLDSISQATGVPEQFRSLYPGTRAMQVPDPEIDSYFLEVFDRPSRQLICERKNAQTLNQALHLISGDTVQKKVSRPDGTLARSLSASRDPAAIVEDLYLGTLSRFPDADERRLAQEALSRAGDPRQGLEDVFWALLNSKEFIYNH